MQVVFINECTSCENSNQLFFNVMFFIFKNKRQTGYNRYCKIKLFSGAILYGASNEPGGVFRTQPNAYEGAFLQNGEQLQAVNYFHKRALEVRM